MNLRISKSIFRSAIAVVIFSGFACQPQKANSTTLTDTKNLVAQNPGNVFVPNPTPVPVQQMPVTNQVPTGNVPGQMPIPGQPIQNGMQPNPNQVLMNGQGPIVVPPISFVDINTGRFGKLEIDLEDGKFLEGSCDNIHLVARDLDLREGVLKSLDISVKKGNLQDFIVDTMVLNTNGSLKFDTGILFNKKILQFLEPAEAKVEVEISQKSLNSFIKAPNTLKRLSLTASNKVGAIANMFGVKAPQLGLSISDGNLKLGKKNAVNIDLQSKVGVGQFAMDVPVEIESRLALVDGWVNIVDTKLKSSGKEISPQLSKMIVDKVNSLSSFGTKSDDIHFKFTKLEVKSNKKLVVRGTAEINRLRFGR